MDSEEIVVGVQWDAVQALHETEELRKAVVRYISHTMNTMSCRTSHYTPFGEVEGEDVTHPMASLLGVIDSCLEGIYKRYGKDHYEQGRLFMDRFNYVFEDEDPNG